jgi:DNA-binding HxlR family transcriptional regulator
MEGIISEKDYKQSPGQGEYSLTQSLVLLMQGMKAVLEGPVCH